MRQAKRRDDAAIYVRQSVFDTQKLRAASSPKEEKSDFVLPEMFFGGALNHGNSGGAVYLP